VLSEKDKKLVLADLEKAKRGKKANDTNNEAANLLKTLESRDKELDKLIRRLYEDICCKGRLSKSSNTVKAAGSSVAV